MTQSEVFKEIIAIPKWYAGVCSPQNATNMKRRYKEGKLRLDTLSALFAKFGYTKSVEQWEKQ